MQADVQWLVHLVQDPESGGLDASYASTLVNEVGADAELASYTEYLGGQGWFDAETLEWLTSTASSYASEGHEPPALAIETDGGGGEAAPAASASVEVADGEMPDFAALAGMDDAALKEAFRGMLKACQGMGAADLHITAGGRPRIRLNRCLEYLSDHIFDAKTAERLNKSFLTEDQIKRFDKDLDLDYGLAFSGGQRLRVNLMVQKEGVSGVYHLVPESILSFEELGYENAELIKGLLSYHNGLILVTGPVGAGKTTTLATMVHEINQSRTDHVITVEDPIEMVQESSNCVITQREVGKHTASFAAALKSALREDPDIIVVGEMRDLETIEMAITASETGHLVIGTMHTRDAASTLSRMLDVFPPSQQNQIRAMTAGSLRGIICQRLLPGTEGGLVLAPEILLNVTAVANLIREGKETGLKSVMQTGKKKGMVLMDDSVINLYNTGYIDYDTAVANIADRNVRRQLK